MSIESMLDYNAMAANSNLVAKKYWNSRLSELELVPYFDNHGKPPTRVEEKNNSEFIQKAPAEVTELLKALTNSYKGQHLVLLSALGILAQKYSSIDDIVIFSPVYDNNRLEGSLNEWIPFRMNDFSTDFAKFLALTKNNFIEDLKHGNYPLQKILNRAKKDLPMMPCIVLITEELHGSCDFELISPDFIFSFSLEGGLCLKVRFNDTRVEFDHAVRLSLLYFDILFKLLKDRNKELSKIELVSGETKLKILNEFNNTNKDFPGDKTIIDLFLTQAKLTPERKAIQFLGQTLTYGELDNRSNQIAHYIKKNVQMKGAVIGVQLERSLELVVAIYGILRSGCVYLPVTGYPKDRVLYVLRNSNCHFLITNEDSFESYVDEFACIDINKISVEPEKAINLSDPNGPAYTIYTSGSTGRPKGVLIRHISIVNRLWWMQNQYNLQSYDIVLQKTPIVFDVSIWELFWWSFTGAKLILADPGAEKDPKKLCGIIDAEGVTVLHFVPSMLNAFLNYWQTVEHHHTLKSIRHLFASGEELSPIDAKTFLSICSTARLHNLYGPTEATVDVSFYEVTPGFDKNSVPIGKPIDNSQLLIFNKDGQLQPIGVRGELHIGGVNLAVGYVNQPDLTASRFIKNPLDESKTLYKTGDFARWTVDGNIEFLGRIDNQVKINGNRIEVGEIECTLESLDEVNKAVVLVTKPESSPQLIAFVIKKSEITVKGLLSFLASKLPDYMIPADIVFIESVPLNLNGKLDKAKLLSLKASIKQEYVAPSNAVETELVDIWSEVLSIDKSQVGIDTPFANLGGNSLSSVFLKNKIAYKLKIELSMNDIFSLQTVRQQGNYISDREKAAVVDIKPMPKKGHYGLTSAQKRLYFLYHFDKLSMAYNMPANLSLKGNLDYQKVENVCQSLIKRHSILRSYFVLVDGKPQQKLRENITFKIEDFTVTKGANVDVARSIQAFSRPFDLAKAPLFRVGIINKSALESILMFDIHHIVCDGISLNILIQEFMMLYRGESLSQITLQFKDYAQWLGLDHQQKGLEKQKNYWLEKFKLLPEPLELPYDHVRKGHPTYQGAAYRFVFTPGKTQLLRDLARERQVSMYMLILSLYNVFLAKVCATADVVVGTVIAGRNHAQLEQLIGMFASTLPLRNNPQGDLAFVDFLERVKNNFLDALDNQDYQYEDFVDELNLERNTARNPLFDTFFVYHNIEQPDLKLPDLEIEPMPFEYNVSKFDLTLSAKEINDVINFEFEFSTELFNKKTISEFHKVFENITDEITKNPNKKISEIGMVHRGEQRRLLELLDNTHIPFQSEKTVADVFEEQADKYPDNIAIESEDEKISYKDLNIRANVLSHYLIDQGIGQDKVVGLLIERSIDMIIAILAIIKAGGGYLPIDPESPKGRVKVMLDDCQATIAITTKKLVHLFPNEIHKIIIDQVKIGSPIKVNPKVKRSVDSLSYVIYTSGTTGKPKGVMVENRNLMSLFFNEEFYFDFGTNDVWTMFHRYSFDFSVWEMYGALLFGGKLIIVSQQDSLDPAAFLEILKTKKVTVLNQTPTAFSHLIQQELEAREIELKLRYVIFGGEALNPKILKPWYKRYPETRLINMFGITETTIHVTFKEITFEDILSGNSNIGRPLPAVSNYILDPDLNMVPQGFSGELYVGGMGVSRGYMNNPKLTDEKFIKDPFRKGGRMYKTGDLVKIRENGDLEYLRRIDGYIQLKGFRIELSEIENALLKYRFVKDAKVLKKEINGEVFLVAYYTANTEIEVRQLRKVLSESIPLYMIPAYFVFVEKIPITANGKTDISELPDPEVKPGKEYTAPHSGLEKVLADIWAKTLGVAAVGIKDNYFALGGDSILAIRLITNINKRLFSSVRIADLYDNQTIRELAIFIEELDLDRKYLDREEVLKEIASFEEDYLTKKADERIEAVYPMSNIEKGMCYVHLKNPQDTLYYEQLLWPIAYSNFDLDRLNTAVQLLTKKQHALRTKLDMNNFAHVVCKDIDIHIPYTDITHLDFEDKKRYVSLYMRKSRENHFDLMEAPLWKMSVFKIGEDNHLILFEIHHAISDGWSIATFMNELNETYQGLEENRGYAPAPLTSTFKDYIIEEIIYNKRDDDIDYWKRELSGFKKLSLGVNNKTIEYRSKRIDFSDQLLERLEMLAIERKGSVKNLFFAAYLYAIKMLTYSSDIVVGLVTFNRAFGEETEKVFGNFLNTVPFRIIFEGLETIEELLNSVDKKLLEIKKYDQTSLYRANKAVGGKEYGENPILDTLFNFTNFHSSYEVTLEKVDVENKENLQIDSFIRGHTLFDLSVNAFKGFTFFDYKYVTSFLDDNTFERFHQYFCTILDLISKGYKGKLTPQTVLPKKEVDQLLNGFNNTQANFPADKSIVDLFQSAAGSFPDNTAVIAANSFMTYSELDTKSTLLARYIVGQGIKPQSVIAVLAERSLEMMIAIFGTLKARCVYMPVDATQPQERINFILGDSNAAMVLVLDKFRHLTGSFRNVVRLQDPGIYTCLEKTELERVSDSDIAYIIYTSGSTGKPKGVVIEHKSVINRLNWMQSAYPIGSEDVILQKTPVIFDVSVWELFWGLFHGASVVMLAPDGEKDPRTMIDTIEQNRVTTIHFVPSMLSVFLNSTTLREFDNRSFKSLKYVFSSGEALKPELVNLFNQVMQPAAISLINLYGPTEATVDVTYFNCAPAGPLAVVPIGKPIDNIQLYILDKNLGLLPLGVTGQLCISGVGLAREYLNREGLTKEKFVENPFRKGSRLYLTGDLARWMPDGNIEYLGRMDDQVKIRGFRIELGEIENQLLSLKGIKEVTVIAKEKKDNHYLVAYYLADQKFETSILKAHLEASLPEYMIPTHYTHLNKMPLTSNGKVDRKRLKELCDMGPEVGGDLKQPKNEIEEKLTKLLCQILGLEKISVDDNFFDIGGDSLNAITLVNEIHREFNIEFSLRNLFVKSSIELMAGFIEENLYADKGQDNHDDDVIKVVI